MDTNKIKAILVFVVATFIAIYLGIAAATAQTEILAWVVGVSTLVICLILGTKIWLIIPFMTSLSLTLMIPGTPTTVLVAQALFIGFSTLLLLTRRLPFILRISEMEFWIGLLTICVVQVYIRNPVGLNIFGGSTVGGRAYFLFGVSLVAALIFCGLRVPAIQLRTAMFVSIIGGLLNFGLGLIGWFFPRLGVWYGAVEAKSLQQGNVTEAIDTSVAGRIDFLVKIPLTLSNWVSSCINPLRGAFHFKWLPLILLSFAFAALSGYRNVIGAVGLTYLVGLFYRGGFVSVVISGLIAASALAVIAIFNSVSPLPPNMQRAFSFLPGTWEKNYVLDGEASTDWRVEIWEEVLLTDRWIHDKILGDGLGYSAKEMAMQESLRAKKMTGTGVSGFDLNREAILSTGDYHSGPVSAIRTIGYIGLLVMGLAQIRTMAHAHRLIRKYRRTEWFTVVLFFGIPTIWYPVFFWFVFGGFLLDGPMILMNAAIIRLLQNNLPPLVPFDEPETAMTDRLPGSRVRAIS